MKTKKQWFFLFIKILPIILVLFLSVIYFFRDSLLEQAILKTQNKFKIDYETTFQIQKASFTGTSSITLENIQILPLNKDTLLSVKKIETEINLFKIITGDLQLQNLKIENGFIQLVKNERGTNFSTFLKKDKSEEITNGKRNYAKLANRVLTQLLNLIPTEMRLQNLTLRVQDMDKKLTFQMQNLSLKDEKLNTQIQIATDHFYQKWNIQGYANARKKQTDLLIQSADTSQITLPYLQEKWGLKTGFDKIRLKVDRIDMNFGELTINGLASINNLTINHPKIAHKDVVIKEAEFDYQFVLGSNFISLSQNSLARLNKIKVKPYLEYNTAEDTLYKLKLDLEKIRAQDFITSLPTGLFSHFEGMEALGDFDYHLNFEVNINKPHQLIFDSKLNKNNLYILKYGQANLEKLNSEFEYRAIENGIPQRPIWVGNSNTHFTPYDSIPAYLKNAVLTSEDPSFFRHRGFITEAFKQSIIKNIRTKRFARGASTISMQLVKNVFLTREKTLSRKLEEILLVYILENNQIASKQRMLEVYFNIIEWGPNIYGISEAAAFYFQKKPQYLNLNECLFLASIVPKPKKFMYQFNEEGKQKSGAERHQKFIKNLMLKRALISTEDTIGQSIPIYISGKARNLLRIRIPKDTTFLDSAILPVKRF
ncbi:transglycosylase domain-containing protein [Flavobacterium davisii]|uniref:Transglycosylase domain-containing protein n=1 Tax=Flavobacterium columnare TaxID=996 RepID=A0A8G0P6T1_9FLAO|nr:biosynthetic peptidoglycan transglycosylase [Flavobacterium davisii]QYS88184.1 transglycosylase domain-containing protein [Flavobacterium davisii]